MPIGLIGGISSLVGGIGSFLGGQSVADAAKQATQLQRDEFNQITTNLSPFLNLGTNAAKNLGSLFGVTQTGSGGTGDYLNPISSVVGAPPSPTDSTLQTQFLQSPGYQYQLKQMIDAVQNSAAGRTGAVSGNAMKSLQTNAQGLASQDWNTFYNNLVNNYANRYSDIYNNRNTILGALTGMAGSGQNAAAQLGGFGQTAASNIGSLGLYGANAQAGSFQGVGNALTSALNSTGGSNALNYLFGNSNNAGNPTWLYGGTNVPAGYPPIPSF